MLKQLTKRYLSNTFSQKVMLCMSQMLVYLVQGEQYQYSLYIQDLLDPFWVYMKSELGSKVQCAALCWQEETTCVYFGYKKQSCYLLESDHLDHPVCSSGNCTDTGMKVYKKRIVEQTTTTADLPSTTSLFYTTETTEQVTTTQEATSELAESSTHSVPVTSSETTTESTTVSTTDFTSTDATKFECELTPTSAETEISCNKSSMLLRGIQSRNRFFTDAFSPACWDVNDDVYDNAEDEYSFFSLDEGFTINANCPEDDHVIVKFKVCLKDAHVPAITIHCRHLLNPDIIEGRFNATSDDMKHTQVDCGEKVGLQRIYFADVGDGVATRVVFECLKLRVKDTLPDSSSKTSRGGGL